MFKTRKQKCEEEAKLDPNYIPTKDLKVDESAIQDDPEDSKKFPWVPVIVMGSIVVLMVICIIVIMAMGGPVDVTSSSL